VGVTSPALKQSVFMKMKCNQFSLGRHSLSDVILEPEYGDKRTRAGSSPP
jgi:hypothetical protein